MPIAGVDARSGKVWLQIRGRVSPTHGRQRQPNGLAQGYVTDRIADLLRRNHIDTVALNLGEARTMGQRIDSRDWLVRITDPANPA